MLVWSINHDTVCDDCEWSLWMKKWIRPLSNKTKWANQEGWVLFEMPRASITLTKPSLITAVRSEACQLTMKYAVDVTRLSSYRTTIKHVVCWCISGRLKSNDAYYGDRMSAIIQKCQGKYGNWHLQVWRLCFILDLYTSLKKRNCNEGDMLGQMLVNVILLIRELMALSIDLWNIQSHVHLYIKQVFDR